MIFFIILSFNCYYNSLATSVHLNNMGRWRNENKCNGNWINVNDDTLSCKFKEYDPKSRLCGECNLFYNIPNYKCFTMSVLVETDKSTERSSLDDICDIPQYNLAYILELRIHDRDTSNVVKFSLEVYREESKWTTRGSIFVDPSSKVHDNYHGWWAPSKQIIDKFNDVSNAFTFEYEGKKVRTLHVLLNGEIIGSVYCHHHDVPIESVDCSINVFRSAQTITLRMYNRTFRMLISR
jgi:hypothetical protein